MLLCIAGMSAGIRRDAMYGLFNPRPELQSIFCDSPHTSTEKCRHFIPRRTHKTSNVVGKASVQVCGAVL